MNASIKAVYAPVTPFAKVARPWLVYLDGERVDTKHGVGRRFATEQAAIRAARRLSSANPR